MMRSVLLYTTLVSLLLALFTYVYLNQQNQGIQKQYLSLEKLYIKQKAQLEDARYFTLENNTSAQNYLEGIDYQKLIPAVYQMLQEANSTKGGNPYTGQDSSPTAPYIINKAQVINDRWAIADFSNGQVWGQVWLQFFVSPEGKIELEVQKTVLYPNR